ncbi:MULTISPECIES: AAA family ATPase [unclassified Endozoicomonas]|uniref:AAA family ATPase n=3 Tax=Endozoicomonas TaxID=305899 RepID=UPI003BB776AC
MDVQIREINKSVLDSGASDNIVPAKNPKLALPANDVEICSDVTARLKVSSPLISSPHQARTVSSTNSSLPGAPHAFDFRFVASDDEIRQLLVARTCDEHRDVTLISHPDDLSQANLMSRLSISEEGQHALYPGKLFEGSQPLTLVLDIRKLTSAELSKFNDLLDPDTPCLYDRVSQKKRPLGKHVSLLVLADPAQLALVGSNHEAPGADFWRRINRPGNTWQFDAQTGNDSLMSVAEVAPVVPELSCAESAEDGDNTVLIDCHLHSHWRQLLLGGPGVDKQGRIQHIPGRLESLRPGQQVILKGANWKDLAFEQTIRQMLAQRCFESNGKVCQLPDDVEFYRMPVRNDELHSLFQSLSHSDAEGLSHNVPPNPVIINQSNIREWLSPIAINPEGYVVPDNCLLERVRAGGVITITSPLNDVLWFRLLGLLQTIHKTTGLVPRLQVTHSRQQPKALGLTENNECPLPGSHQQDKKDRDQTSFSIVTYQQHAQVSHWIKDHLEAPLVIQVNDQTSFSQLFDNIHITSEQKAHFERSQSELQKALIAGKPVVFLGLESNPTLQQLLEPLAIGQHLLVNGQLQAYPQAHVTLFWPESAKSPSPVFRSMVATGKPCPEVDLWDINARKHDIPRTELPEQALNKLYEAFKTVPGGLCNPLPEMTEGLLNNLILAAQQAQRVDHSLQLLPCHWRKAINSVVTHGTRQSPPVRDFMKVACWHLLPDKDQAASVDPDRLTVIINRSRRLDRKFVKQNLWLLARAFDPAVFKGTELKLSYENPLSLRAEKEVLDRLCAIIVAHAPEAQRQAIAYQLKVDSAAAEQYQALAIRRASQIKRLQDALASGWQLKLPSGQTRSDAIHALASDCFHIARGEYVTENPVAERIERIEKRLSQSMQWPGCTDQPLSALARDLYHGEMSQKDRESRRLSRLHDRLSDSPVIFLQGETGTGKSYFSAKMAKASGPASVISLGPSDSEETLMKRWQWQEHADGDRSMVQQNRALMEWANTKSDKDGEYITLVLDEANLAKAGLLSSLNGLWEPEPCIYVNAHPVKVSAKHRVILTGNPDHYAGRQLDPALKEKLPRAYYPRLDQAFLRDRVVEPALLNQLQRHLTGPQINKILPDATGSVMALWQYYQELLPEHEFTPRDLTDICSWVGWYLDRALSEGESVSCEQMNSLIRQSFRDLLGPEISETQQDALSALEIWFAARYPLDNTLRNKVHNHTLPDIQRDFEAFTKEFRPEFDTSGSAVIELVQGLGQDLSRCQQANHREIKHGGRQATLIEGPAGRGKDATLNLMINSVKQQAEKKRETMPEIFLLNACDCSWDKVCEAIRKAKVEGGIVVISEMNLIDSQHLEGELNDILAGDAHPGFHLFATINPPEYSGRKPLSPALKGRFRHLPIRQYNQTELQTIAEKVLPLTPEGKAAAEKLTQKHCRLRAYLQRKNLPLQPTSLDLQNVARAVIREGDFGEDSLNQCLGKHYRLYLMAADLSLEKLPESSALAMDKSELDSGLCKWFNLTVSDISRPWLIRPGDGNSIDEKHHEIRFEPGLTKEETKTEIIKMMAQTGWQASGLSLKPNQSDDILTRTLYRHWQQGWFNRVYGRTGVDVNSVFPLTKEERQMLKTPASQPYLREADRQIGLWNSNSVKWCRAFWHQISDLPKRGLDNYVNEGKQTKTLDRRTGYEGLKKPQVNDCKIFDTKYITSRMYRFWASDFDVTAEGEINQFVINDRHIQGFEALTPAPLPGRDQSVTLATNQTLATYELSSKNGQYALPSLTPDDYIVALRIEPNMLFTLVRDRYTGLHTLTIPEAKANQKILCAYVVEPKKPGKKTTAEESQSEGSDRSVRFDALCSEGMKTVLKKLFMAIEDQPSEIQQPLEAIKNAENRTQRVKAIKDYCLQFSGKAKPAPSEHFFQFLVKKRQGSCRHRVPVFVALCRYFGIPCRQINNLIHSFAEYSLDGGQTWESADLGGAPVLPIEIRPDFQHNRKVGAPDTELETVKNLLKGADLAKQPTLAEASVVNSREQYNTLETKSALPETDPSPYERVLELWKIKTLGPFSMGVSMLASMDTEALGEEEKSLIGTVFDGRWLRKPMSEAVCTMLNYYGEGDQVAQQLKLLYSKMIDQAGADSRQWLGSIVDILAKCNFHRASVVRFAHEALASGWLDPMPEYETIIVSATDHYKLLMRLKDFDELRVKATHCLKKFYKQLLSREKNIQFWQSACKYHHIIKGNDFFATHSHDGFSPFLEANILCTSLKNAWTNQPDGTPNIERMLVHQPAFPKLASGKDNHRPVIILGQPVWSNTLVEEKAEELFQLKVENTPYLKQLLEIVSISRARLEQFDDELQELSASREKALRKLKDEYMKALHTADDPAGCTGSLPLHEKRRLAEEVYNEKTSDIEMRYKNIKDSVKELKKGVEFGVTLKSNCNQLIRQAFSHYLYELTHSKGGRLTYCWGDANGVSELVSNQAFGSHEPSSPEELYTMMSAISSSSDFQRSVNDAYLKQAQDASNALVLKNAELTKIAKEFLNSMNLNSLYNSLDAR